MGGVVVAQWRSELAAATGVPSLKPGSHAVHHSTGQHVGTVAVAAGGSPEDTMWSTSTLLEHLGVRFRITEDVVSDNLRRGFTASTVLHRLRGVRSGVLTPSFTKRGLQPFHDFSAGPDWWNEGDPTMNLTSENLAADDPLSHSVN